MKVIAVLFAFLLAGVSAYPSQQSKQLEAAIRSGEPRIISGIIVELIDYVAQYIADAGLDPLSLDSLLELDFAAPVPTVFNARIHIRGVNSRGLSNIVINHMNYALLTGRLTFNVELPGIALSIGDAAWDVNILSANLNGALSGSAAVRNIVITGDVRISLGIADGISIRDMALTVSIGDIDSNLNFRLQDMDLSDGLNHFVGVAVPNDLKNFEDDINELVTIVVRQIVESIL